MNLKLSEVILKVNSIFEKYDSATEQSALVGEEWKAGKVYEAWVLAVLLEKLQEEEGFEVQLVGGTKVHLKSSPGPINPKYPFFRLTHPGGLSYDMWTDVEFATMSYAWSGNSGTPQRTHRHELDLLVVTGGVMGYPSHADVIIGVECKNTGFSKGMARAALGVRRELSLLSSAEPTSFVSWPRSSVPASPPSVLLVCSTDSTITDFNSAGTLYGVDFCHLPMP